MATSEETVLFREYSLERLEVKPHLTTTETNLSVKAASAMSIPLKDLSFEQIRLFIGQKAGLELLIPLALEILQANIFAQGDLFEGDLLLSVLRVKENYWKDNLNLRDLLIGLIEKEEETISANSEIKFFRDEIIDNYKKLKESR